MAKAIDFIRMVQRGAAPPPPVARLIGFTLTEVEPGRAVIAFDADGRHANPMGTLHGGVLCERTVGLVECDVLDDRERLVARASSTCMTLRGPQAEGR